MANDFTLNRAKSNPGSELKIQHFNSARLFGDRAPEAQNAEQQSPPRAAKDTKLHGSFLKLCDTVNAVRAADFSGGAGQNFSPLKIGRLIHKSFGANVRRLRFEAGLTQARLAERTGVELRTEQKFESGEIHVPLTTLVRIQKALACRWEELLGRTLGT